MYFGISGGRVSKFIFSSDSSDELVFKLIFSLSLSDEPFRFDLYVTNTSSNKIFSVSVSTSATITSFSFYNVAVNYSLSEFNSKLHKTSTNHYLLLYIYK